MSTEKGDLGGDYTLVPVPASKRKSWLDVALVWMGMNICPPTLLLGVWLMRYLDFTSACLAVAAGLVFLSIFSILQGIIGNRTGLPTYPLSRLAFGDVGGRIFSFLMFLSLIGWFGIMTESLVATFYSQIFPAAGIKPPPSLRPLLAFISGLIITGICFFGFRAIAWLNRITIPGLLFLSFFALYKVMKGPELIHRVLTWLPPAKKVPLYSAVIWVVGTLIVAAVTAPDFNRYCRRDRDTVYSVLLGNVPVVFFLTVMGMIFAILSGAAEGRGGVEAADLSSVFATQGWKLGPVPSVYLAVFILVGAIITTNVVNLYPGAMALVTVLKGAGKIWPYLEDRAVLTLFVGVAGSLAASAGILSRFESFLELLTNFAVPLIGIMSSDFFILRNRRIKGTVNLTAFFTWILFSILSTLGKLPGGSLAAVVYSAAVYTVAEIIKEKIGSGGKYETGKGGS